LGGLEIFILNFSEYLVVTRTRLFAGEVNRPLYTGCLKKYAMGIQQAVVHHKRG
jgi:hypothetical protein